MCRPTSSPACSALLRSWGLSADAEADGCPREHATLLPHAAAPQRFAGRRVAARRAVTRADARRARATAAGGVPTLLCASGRGGSGTTLVSALLAVAAAGEGYRVLLIDADELVGPLAMMLGVTPRASWLDLRGGRVTPADVATPVSTTLTLVAGGAPRAADRCARRITAAERRACMRRVSALAERMDLVVIDCGSRASNRARPPSRRTRMNACWRSPPAADPIGLASTYALCKARRTPGTVPFRWMYSSIGMRGATPPAASTPSMPVPVSSSEPRCAWPAPFPPIRRSMPRSARGCRSPMRRPALPQRLPLTMS